MNEIVIVETNNITTLPETSLAIVEKPQRIAVVDYLRGIGIMVLIFIHGIVYHYGLFDELDLENLNPFFMIIYLILNWAGFFAIISSIVNTYSSFFRLKSYEKNNDSHPAWRAFGKRWLFLGFFFLIMNFIYNYFFSPFVYDFDTKTASYSFFTGLIRSRGFYMVPADKIFQGSALAMLGWNLIILGLYFTLLFRRNAKSNLTMKKILTLAFGIIIILVSFTRIYFFADLRNAFQNGNYGLAFLIDIVFGEYFPILPYLGFGFIGSYLGLVLVDNPTKIKLRRQIWIGVGFILASVIAFLIPDSVYAYLGLLDDIFVSYISILFEIGLFILIGVPLLLLSERRKEKEKNAAINNKKKFPNIILLFSKNSLTFFLLERIIAEIFGLILDLIIPGWNDYIWSCLLFGGFLVIFWIGIALLWNLIDFRFSFEWCLVKLFKITKFSSNKSY